MPERNSQPLELATGNLGQVQGYSPSRAQVEQVDHSLSLGEQALSGLLDFGVKTSNDQFQTQVGEAYMQGQRARMLGQSIEQVDTDTLAAPFVRGGYQDQDYRIKQAEFSLEMQQFIATKGKEMPPEAFVQELATKARPVVDRMTNNGMSNFGKAEAIKSQTSLEETLMAAHSKAYTENAIAVAGQQVTTQGNSILSTYLNARTTGVAVDAAAGALTDFYVELTRNPELPAEMRQKIANNFLLTATELDAPELVRALEASGQLDSMAFEDRKTLTEAMRDTENRTKLRDHQNELIVLADLQNRIKDGDPVSVEEVQSITQQAISAGVITQSGLQSIYRDWQQSAANAYDTQQLAAAWSSGNVSQVYAMGKTLDDAFAASEQQMLRGNVPAAQRIQTHLLNGAKVGYIPASVRGPLNAAVGQALLNPAAMDATNEQLLTGYLDQAALLESNNPSASAVWLSAVDSTHRGLMSRTANLVKGSGMTPMQAFQQAAGEAEAYKGLPDDVKNARKAALKKAIPDALEMSTWQQAVSLGTTGSRIATTGVSAQQHGLAVQLEAYRLLDMPEWAGVEASEVVAQATSNVQAKTLVIPVKDSQNVRLMLPANVTLQRLTGVDDPTTASQAIADVYTPSAPNLRMDFYTQPGTNAIYAQEYDKDTGVAVGDRRLVDWENKVKPRATYLRDGAYRERQPLHLGAEIGAGGTEYRAGISAPGETVRADGINTANVPREQAYAFRQRLVAEEGVNYTVYADHLGNPTVGAGLHVPELAVGTVVPKAAADKLFAERTDEALRVGAKLVRGLGIPDPDNIATVALSGMVYQLGEPKVSEFKGLMKALQQQDWRAFEQEARDSTWFQQTPARVESLLDQMRGYFGANPM